MSRRKRIMNKHDLRKSIEKSEAYKLKNAYVQAARQHFEAMWSNVLKELDPIQRSRALLLCEQYAQDFADQAEKGLIAGRAGFQPAGYTPPSKQ